MGEQEEVTYLHVNRDGRWPDFEQVGLDLRPDGAWQLAAVPLLAGAMPEEVARLPVPDGPAGVAVGPDGTVFFSQPAWHRVMSIDGCDGAERPLLCMGGEGTHPTQLRTPRGLMYHPLRGAIFVADSGNNRIQIFDPETLQLREIWGHEPGTFDEPWALAHDDEGSVYVVDYGNGRVRKFDLRGRVQPDFEQNSKPHLKQPVQVAVTGQGESTQIYVLDNSRGRIVVFDKAGNNRREIAGELSPMSLGLAVADRALYVGDNSRRRLLKFKKKKLSFPLIGAALGYEGPVAALAADAEGGLWLHPGGELAPLWLAAGKAYVQHGVLWGGPFGPGDRPVAWHRLKAIAAPLESGAHIQFFAHVGSEPPPPPAPETADPFSHHDWQRYPPDVLDLLIHDTPEHYIWLGAHLSGEGMQSPLLAQIRLSYDHKTYRQHLPAIFSEKPAQRLFLDKTLSLFESFFNDTEEEIAHLSRLFDPQAAPMGWLSWLAGWMALELDENWSEAQKRAAIATALAAFARRGTAQGLKESLRLFAGVDAHIDEPIVNAGWWALAADEPATTAEAEGALLGFTTMLAPVEADGAVVGTTAVLDQAHLISQDEFGKPLFENMAHQFSVQVYRGQASNMDQIRGIIESEKPAHTIYHLCVINPQMRVGFQARLGIDTIVAGPTPPSRLGQADNAAFDLTLSGPPPGQIGAQNQVGITTRLGGAR